MAMTFPNLSPWLWSKPASQQENGASSPPAAAPRDAENVQYTVHKHTYLKKPSSAEAGSSSLKSLRRPTGRRRWQSRSERRCLDTEFDMVLVPSDGGCCLSGSDSDDSDWSVGWFEPHASDFSSDNEPDNSFAVLVPCYGSPSPDFACARGRFSSEREEKSNSQLWAAVLSNISKGGTTGDNCYLGQWLSSPQG